MLRVVHRLLDLRVVEGVLILGAVEELSEEWGLFAGVEPASEVAHVVLLLPDLAVLALLDWRVLSAAFPLSFGVVPDELVAVPDGVVFLAVVDEVAIRWCFRRVALGFVGLRVLGEIDDVLIEVGVGCVFARRLDVDRVPLGTVLAVGGVVWHLDEIYSESGKAW